MTTLQNDIKTRQQTIQRLKTINRSCQVHLVLFSSIFYGGYTVFLLLQYKLSISTLNKSSLALLVLFPIGVFYFKRLLAGVFNFIINRKQNVLKIKQTELKDRIEELKVETRYYQTKDLIEKYDKSAAEVKTETEVSRRNIKQSPVNNASLTSTVSASTGRSVGSPGTNNNVMAMTVSNNPRIPLHPAQLSPPQHPIRLRPAPFRSPTWMDRFMDALIGDDSRNQKYALICSQCFNHNGLATPELFETARYRCPNCGFFNHKQPSRQKKTSEIEVELEGEGEGGRIQEVTETKAVNKAVDKPVSEE